jgi:4-hydroxy-3-methylbut-2-enyl diphosphate reductase
MRQAELRQLYPKADCIIVVGGRDSANTSRLTSIARDLGRPVFQVESPEDIDPSAIRGFRRILVTAGASTPSWVIRRVRGRLLELQGATVGRAIGLLGSLVLGNFHIIPAAAALGTAGAFAVGNPGWVLPLASASLALFSLHGLNTVMEAGFSTTSGEEREAFVRRHRGLLTAASFIGLAASVALSALLPPLWGGCLALSLFMFVAYSAPLLGGSTLPPGGIRSIPGSRDTLFALAWAFLLSILPALTKGSSGAAAVALWSIQLTLLLLGRSLLLDLVDLQGDAMMGRDTIPLALGASRSRALLWMTVLAPPALLLAGVAAGLLPLPALGAATGHVWLAAGYSRLRRTPFPSELAARLCADGSLFASGAAPVLMALSGLGG